MNLNNHDPAKKVPYYWVLWTLKNPLNPKPSLEALQLPVDPLGESLRSFEPGSFVPYSWVLWTLKVSFKAGLRKLLSLKPCLSPK